MVIFFPDGILEAFLLLPRWKYVVPLKTEAGVCCVFSHNITVNILQDWRGGDDDVFRYD